MTKAELQILAEHSRSVSRVLEEGREKEVEITDETMVLFEGKRCRWGDLCVQDRKAYWLGGYGF